MLIIIIQIFIIIIFITNNQDNVIYKTVITKHLIVAFHLNRILL